MRMYLAIFILIIFGVPNFSYTENFSIIFKYVNGSEFIMGDDSGELWEETSPEHSVTLTYDYYVSESEITTGLYMDYCELTDRETPVDTEVNILIPVTKVSWFDAIAFCNWLSKLKHLPTAYNEETGDLLDAEGNYTDNITEVVGFRLLTEAEWEFAASGGRYGEDTLFSGSDDANEVAWHAFNSFMQPQVIMLLEPNDLGIYDMSGNVWEWCTDRYKPYQKLSITNPVIQGPNDYKIVRGGAYTGTSNRTRVKDRDFREPDMGYENIGFRIGFTENQEVMDIIK